MSHTVENRELLDKLMKRIAVNRVELGRRAVYPIISKRKQLEENKRRKKFPGNLSPCVQCPSGARVVHDDDNEIVAFHCGDMALTKDEHIPVHEAQSKCPRKERWVAHHTTKHHRKAHG